MSQDSCSIDAVIDAANMDTGFIKLARFTFEDVHGITANDGMVKVASVSGSIKLSKDAEKVLKEEVAKRPDAVYFRAKAIEADIPNNNGDSFSTSELKKACQSFVGVPFFTNHQNTDVEKAKGKVVYAEWDEDSKAIYVIAFVDRQSYPSLARAIEKEYVTGVSMGCAVQYSRCSICRNKAMTQEEYCPHIRTLKGRKFTGTARDAETGEVKEFKDADVFEDNFGLRFIELSGVVDPACQSCQIDTVYDNGKFHRAAMAKAAGMLNGLYMVKNSSMYRDASEDDVNKLNQALATLEEITVKLIQNRENIEMEFAANLVKILSDLQVAVDELVQAGFGRLPESGVPGMAPEGQIPGAQGTETGFPAASGGEQAGIGQPISEEQPLSGEVGSLTGNDQAPLVSQPTTPEAGLAGFKNTVRPSPDGAQTSKGLTRPVRPSRAANDGESEMRRVPQVMEQARAKIKHALSEDWQGKVNKARNDLQASIQKDVQTSESEGTSSSIGGNVMSSSPENRVVEAKAKEVPNEVIETRLDDGTQKYMARQGPPQEAVLGKQLQSQHGGSDTQQTYEGNLESVREDSTPKEVPERYLEPTREGLPKERVQDKQLAEEGNQVGVHRETITEDQLSHQKVDSPQARSAATIQDHTKAAIDVLAKAVTLTQSTPKKALRTAAALAGSSLSEQTKIVEAMINVSDAPDIREAQARAAYWQKTSGLNVFASNDAAINKAIIAYAGQAVSEKALDGEKLLRCLGFAATSKFSAAAIETRVKELLAQTVEEEADEFEEMEESIRGLISTEEEIVEETTKEAEEEVVVKAKTEQAKVVAESRALKQAMAKAEQSEDATYLIETTVDEVGLSQQEVDDDVVLAAKATAFARGVCGGLGKKLAAVVNVTVDGETGDVVIAVDTDGESVEIPVGGAKDELPEAEELPPEEELPPVEEAPPAPEMGASTPPASGGMPGAEQEPQFGAFTSSKKKPKTAKATSPLAKASQFGGGNVEIPAGQENAGGQAPGAGAPENGLMGGAPGEGPGVQTFTGEEEEDESIPGDEEQMMPGSICPLCGSTDTETGRKDQAPGQFECKTCGAKYEYSVSVELLNFEDFKPSEEGDDFEEPEVPTLPVAAQIQIDRGAFKKMAATEKEYGYVCPACGSSEVKTTGNPDDVTIACSKCQTVAERSVLINVKNPEEAMLQIAWTLDPMKRKCIDCRKGAKKFAADLAFKRILKKAKTIEVPADKVRAFLSQLYPDFDTVRTGPYKGRPLVDTVVAQASRFGLTKIKDIKALAEAQICEDDMDRCLREQRGMGYTLAEATRLCNCMREKYETEDDRNIYMAAFGDRFDKTIIRKMAAHDEEVSTETEQAIAEQTIESISDDMDIFEITIQAPETPENVHNSSELAQALTEEAGVKTAQKKGKDGVTKVEYGKVKEKSTARVNTMADEANEKPKASRSLMGNEENVPAADGPDVPRADATMGKETKPPAEGVKVPTKGKETDNYDFDQTINTESLGFGAQGGSKGKMEKKAYGEIEPMKRNENAEHTNPDDTSGDTALDEVQLTEKNIEQVPCIQQHDDVPRNCGSPGATINDEEPFDAVDPDIPRSSSNMGNEKPFSAEKPKVPSEVAETDVTMRGRDAAAEQQMAKVAQARRDKAQRLAGLLAGKGVIKEEEIEAWAEDFSHMALDRMEKHVQRMLTASAKPAAPTLSVPITQESELVANHIETAPQDESDVMVSKLASCFTIGSRQHNRHIRADIAERKRDDETLWSE